MAQYTKTVLKGRVINTLQYRGHKFTEIWEKDGVLECKGSTISTELNHLFEILEDRELSIVENLENLDDYDLEEAINELSEYEDRYTAGEEV